MKIYINICFCVQNDLQTDRPDAHWLRESLPKFNPSNFNSRLPSTNFKGRTDIFKRLTDSFDYRVATLSKCYKFKGKLSYPN